MEERKEVGTMTDNEIIKSLEICANNGDCKECHINPHKGNYGYCTSLAINKALDLIKRQQAEIERLKERIIEVQRCDMELIETLHKAHEEETENVKAEAIKEFAERAKKELTLLKKECRKVLDNDGAFAIDRARKKIDNLVKEMVGETNDR